MSASDARTQTCLINRDLHTMLWVHDLARISKREYMHDFAAWLNADDLLCGTAAAIAEHIVREEVDVGVVQGR